MLTVTLDGNEVTLEGTTKGDDTQRAAIRRPWVWSRHRAAYVLPRNLRPATRAHAVRAVKAALEAAGHPVEVVDTGVRLTVAEERAQEAERLEARADRLEHRAERLAGEAEGRFATVDGILDQIPMGQPILVGHHSEGRHRRALAKVDTNMRRGIAAEREATDAARRAEGITRRLEDGTPTATLLRRIERHEVEVRDIDRRLDGTSVASNYGRPATGAYRERLLELRAREQEAIDLDRAEIARRQEEDGVKVWGPSDFVKGDEIAYWGGWAEVLRVNKKSVTVPSGYSWTNTVTYDKVTARRRDGQITK